MSLRDDALDKLNERMQREWKRLDEEAQHSVRADVRVLDRKSIAETAAKNHARVVYQLERLERDCAAAFSELEKRAAEVQELGTRAEPLWERLPILNAGHNVWQADKVGPAPVPVSG